MSRLPTWAKILLAIASVVIVVPLGFAAVVAWSFSGGWDGIRPQADGDDRRVVRARERAAAPLDRSTAGLLPVVGGTELARARTNWCQTGQNNWKIHDGYTLSCELTDVVVLDLGVPAGADGNRVDAALRGAGYLPVYDGAGLGGPGSSSAGLSGSYSGPAGQLEVQLVDGTSDDPLPDYGGEVVAGDAAAVRAAVQLGRGQRAVVRVTDQYFRD